MKKRFWQGLGALAMAAVLTACSQGTATAVKESVAEPAESATQATESAQATEAAPEVFETAKVRLAYMPNMGSASLAVTARDKGFFEEMGLEVEMVEFQGGPAEIAAMASGDIDISQIGHGAHALCAEGEAVVFQIDCTSLADAVIANKSKGISSIEELKGKTVATTSGTSAEIILNLALQSKGMTMEDIEVVEMDANGIVSAMVSGNVDACATWSPGTTQILEALGADGLTLANNMDFLSEVTFPSSYITTQKYYEANGDVLVRFARALQKAANYRAENIEEIAKLVARQCEVEESVMLGTVNEGNWLTGDFIGLALADGTIKSYYENQQQVFINSGRLKEAVDVNNYILFEVMQEAWDANNK